MIQIKESKEGVIFEIYVTPHASRAQINGIQDGALKIKVTAQPHEGAANAACVELLAKSLKLKKTQVEIIAGFKSRKKIIFVKNESKNTLEARMKKYDGF